MYDIRREKGRPPWVERSRDGIVEDGRDRLIRVERGPAGEMMPEMLRRYTNALGAHREDAEPQER